MEVVHERCAGVDVSKKDAKVGVRTPGKTARSFTTTVTTWSSMTSEVLALADHLVQARVSLVVMEATSDYWRPFYYVFEDAGLNVILVNAASVKNMPGRKSDVSDAAWLADLGAHGLVRACFVPPAPIRVLRDYTRARTALVRDRNRQVQRLEKLLEDAGIKLGVVASDIVGVSGRAMLEALITAAATGQVIDPAGVADLARARLRTKIGALTEALNGRFDAHHGVLARLYLDQYDALSAGIEALNVQIEEAMTPFRDIRDLLTTIPGVSVTVADVIVAETGADMSVFPTPGQLASWAGLTPGSNSSAGKVKSTRTRPGNPYLAGALGTAAMAASRSKTSYLAARYRRITTRRGPSRAIVAIEHTILVGAWHMIVRNEPWRDLGPDYYTRLKPQRSTARALATLRTLGYDVTLSPHEPPVTIAS